MEGILALVITAAAIGIVVTYVQPYVVGIVPASLKSNQYLGVLTVGAVTLVSLFVAVFILKAIKLPSVVKG